VVASGRSLPLGPIPGSWSSRRVRLATEGWTTGSALIGTLTFTGAKRGFTISGMTRVAIIGNAGGGKSTLGRRLSALHDLPFFSVDQVQWLPGWVAAPEQEVGPKLDRIASGDRWIIDGWGPWPSIESRLTAADTIIFVDLPLWVHFWLAAERQISAARGEDPSDAIEGCDRLDVTGRLFETIWRVHHDLKPRLEELVDRCKAAKDYRHITSLEALDSLAA
jgi:adenylate kinase family enzyme